MENIDTKIAVIGAGSVGSTIAYTLVMKNLAAEVILVDINEAKEEGEVMDINDALSFVETGKIKGGDYKDASSADIIIITAGLPQKTGEQSRLELVNKNKEILKSIFGQLVPISPETIIVIVSNPVDIMTFYAQELSGLPKNQVFGTGTSLDTARLRTEIALALDINAQSVNGFVLGEHGESEFVAWSTVNVGGVPINEKLSEEISNGIAQKVKDDAKNIIDRKGATFYGIAAVTSDIVESILMDQDKVLPISTRIENWNGVDGICLGVPAVLGRGGVKSLWSLELTDNEKSKLRESADQIKKYL
jgi:L-lactate dehydrogenase